MERSGNFGVRVLVNFKSQEYKCLHAETVECSVHIVVRLRGSSLLKIWRSGGQYLTHSKIWCSGSFILQRSRIQYAQLEGINTLHALKVLCSSVYFGCRGFGTQ